MEQQVIDNALDRRAALDSIESAGTQLKAAGADSAAVDDFVSFRKAQFEAAEAARIEDEKKMPLSVFSSLSGKDQAAYIAKGGQLKDD